MITYASFPKSQIRTSIPILIKRCISRIAKRQSCKLTNFAMILSSLREESDPFCVRSLLDMPSSSVKYRQCNFSIQYDPSFEL